MGKTRAMTSDCNWKNVESLEGTITLPSTVVAKLRCNSSQVHIHGYVMLS
jgi:hypothetical protein